MWRAGACLRMRSNPIVSADDFGLTKTNVASILEAVDHGAVTSVSILANGEAVDEALQQARTRNLRIAAHLNLTEGIPLLPKEEVSELVGSNGHFRHGLLSLMFLSKQARAQAGKELAAQWQRLNVTAADGHQHVHMIPWVFTLVRSLPGVTEIRIPDEPWHFTRSRPVASCGPRAFGGAVLSFLAQYNRVKAPGLAANDYFLGQQHSGRVDLASLTEGVRRVAELPEGTLEIMLHPGHIEEAELPSWKDGHANRAWQRSPWRARERSLAMSTAMKELLAAYTSEALKPSTTRFIFRVTRYLVSGGLAALANLVIFYALTDLFGVWYLLSGTLSLGLSMVVSFIFQKYWTFADRTQATGIPSQMLGYLVLDGTNLVINAALLYFFVDVLGLWYLLAGFLSILLLAIESYIVLNHIIFRSSATSDWLSFWNGSHSIYVSKRHLDFHTKCVAHDILKLPGVQAGAKLLDFGSGDALGAPLLAAVGVQVSLYDPAPAVEARNRSRFANEANIRVLDAATLDASQGVFDVILVNSVLQYVAKEELSAFVARLKPLLAPGGTLYLADVVPEHVSTLQDVRSLLSFAAQGGFLFAALLGLVRTYFSTYRKLRAKQGFSEWNEKEFLSVLEKGGWQAKRMMKNIGPSPHRMLFAATVV